MTTTTILTFVLIFIAGLIVDLLTTFYTQAIASKKVWYATILSGVITIANYGLIAYILTDMNAVHNIMAYGFGNTFGTFIAMKRA